MLEQYAVVLYFVQCRLRIVTIWGIAPHDPSSFVFYPVCHGQPADHEPATLGGEHLDGDAAGPFG